MNFNQKSIWNRFANVIKYTWKERSENAYIKNFDNISSVCFVHCGDQRVGGWFGSCAGRVGDVQWYGCGYDCDGWTYGHGDACGFTTCVTIDNANGFCGNSYQF